MARIDQERTFARRSGLASDAAACFLELGKVQRAVELLEQGRGILLRRQIEARSDLTDLRAQRPDLAEKIENIQIGLDSISRHHEAADTTVLDKVMRMALGDVPKRSEADREPPHSSDVAWQEQLLVQYDEVLGKIRELSGFERFALGLKANQLVDAAKHGPIVILNVSQFRSDAIILDPSINDNGIDHISLDGLSPQAIDDITTAVESAVETVADGGHSVSDVDDEEQFRRVLRWLWDTIASKIFKSLGITVPTDPSTSLPRLWWCPTGRLSYLPIHAAGPYDQPGGPCVLDYVVSSYTPTVRALVHAREQVADRAGATYQQEQLLIVAMPNTPGWAYLPQAESEADLLLDLFPDTSLSLKGPDATRHSVLAAIRWHRLAHFACHAEVKGGEPSASRLLLSDWVDRPLTVRDLSKLKLDSADLAYLSVCQSADVGALAIADESIHLASAFQLAGFPCVVATLWPVGDFPAKKVARNFYTALARNMDPSQACQLLHDAVCSYRTNREDHPSLWASFIHTGA